MIYPEPEKGGREMPLRRQWSRRVVTVGLGDVGGVDSHLGVKKQMQRSMLSFFGIVHFGHFAGLTQRALLGVVLPNWKEFPAARGLEGGKLDGKVLIGGADSCVAECRTHVCPVRV
jgi:hypothetical protein